MKITDIMYFGGVGIGIFSVGIFVFTEDPGILIGGITIAVVICLAITLIEEAMNNQRPAN